MSSLYQHQRDLLKKHGLLAKKAFGQNFLVDEAHLSNISQSIYALACRDGKQRPVFEVGAGLGALTGQLLQRGLTVLAIERDRDLLPILKVEFHEEIARGQLTLFEADAVKFDYEAEAKKAGLEEYLVCGNLPYHLTSPILFNILEQGSAFEGSVFMVQKEVGLRICSAPSKKSYGLLSILAQCRFDGKVVHIVPSEAFMPAPKVDSCVITLTPHARFDGKFEFDQLKALVKAAFHQRRKTLKNTLAKVDGAVEALAKLNIDPKLRPENLTVEQFVELTALVG